MWIKSDQAVTAVVLSLFLSCRLMRRGELYQMKCSYAFSIYPSMKRQGYIYAFFTFPLNERECLPHMEGWLHVRGRMERGSVAAAVVFVVSAKLNICYLFGQQSFDCCSPPPPLSLSGPCAFLLLLWKNVHYRTSVPVSRMSEHTYWRTRAHKHRHVCIRAPTGLLI